MNDQTRYDRSLLPLEILERIDRICGRFEAEWESGGRPRIEDFLDEIAESYRAALLGDLLAAELDARRRRGECPRASEYLERLPNDAATVVVAFAVKSVQGADGSGTEVGIETLEIEVLRGIDAGSTRPADPDAHCAGSFAGRVATADGQRFRVLRSHAKGGLGAVFVALDQELHREVALKEIQESHADDPDSRSRFLLEAEITGGLEHPGIVPVYGLGTYGDGRPYYAMRFIRGDSLTEAIEKFHARYEHRSSHWGERDAARQESSGGGWASLEAASLARRDSGGHSLELRKLLRRFLDLCNAIDYAHSRGVLHRDLKPGNVIVGKYGETLVVDWGLAKALGRVENQAEQEEQPLTPPSASGSAQTLPGSALGTPAYMSPEQAAGDLERMGPRSDVYSLGATLYCLLTGKPPFVGNDVGVVLRAVQEGTFPRPRTIDLTIDKSLEAVCLKTMATLPENRYASARELADDIERWLADEPVGARREPATERLRRWGRRHRPFVTGTAGLLIASTVAIAIGAMLLGRANARTEQRRLEAERNYEMARDAVDQYFTRVSEDRLLNEPHMERLRKDLLGTAREFYHQFVEKREGEPSARADLGMAHLRLSNLDSALGATSDAVAQGRRARELFSSLFAEHPEVPAYKHHLAESALSLGKLHRSTGETIDSLASLKMAAELLEGLASEYPKVTEYPNSLASAYIEIGHYYLRAGQSEEAEASYRRSLTRWDQLATEHPEVASHHRAVAACHTNLGMLYDITGQRTKAEAELDQSRIIWEHLVADYPGVAEYRHGLARTLHNLGLLYQAVDRLNAAAEALRRGVELEERLAAEHPQIVEYRSRLADSCNSLGDVSSLAGRLQDAETFLRRAITLSEALATQHPEVHELASSSAQSHNNLGAHFFKNRRWADAETEFKRSLEVKKRLASDQPDQIEYVADLGSAYGNLGSVRVEAGDPRSALDWWAIAIATLEPAVAREPMHANARLYLRNAHLDRSAVYRSLGRTAEALSDVDRAVKLDDGRQREEIRLYRTAVLAGTGKYQEAITEAEALTRLTSLEAGRLDYGMACMFAVASTSAREDTTQEPQTRAVRAEHLAARAVEWLGRARAAGFFRDGVAVTDPSQEHDLDSLRGRPDFQLLTGELTLPSDPFAR